MQLHGNLNVANLKDMKLKNIILFAGLTSVIVACSHKAAVEEREAKTCKAKSDFATIIQVVNDHFYDPKFKGLDWKERVSFYGTQIKCNYDDQQVAAVVNNLLAELKTSHTAVFTKQDLKYWMLKSVFSGDLSKFQIPFTGIWPIKKGHDWYAQNVLPGSAAEKAGVRMGDRLLTINGQPFEPLGYAPRGESVFRITSDGEITRDVRITPVTESLQEAFLEGMKNSTVIYPEGNKKIAYVHLWCGTHDEFLNTLNVALDRFKSEHVDGLIVDLRDGVGGAYPEYFKKMTEDSFLKTVPKIFLINGGITSGKEWLAAIAKRDHLGKLIGTTTAGAFMAGAPFEIENGHYFLYLAVKEFNPPKIPAIEGKGVGPDQFVEGCTELCQGKDLQLAAALKIFSQTK